MHVEHASLWIVPVGEARRPYLLLKMPSHILKQIVKGCSLVVWLACYARGNDNIMMQGLIIHEPGDSPLIVVGRLRDTDELEAIRRLLVDLETDVILFDELARPVARSSITIANSDADQIKRHLPQEIWTGEYSEQIDAILDDFQYRLDPWLVDQVGSPPEWMHSLAISTGPFTANDICAIVAHGAHFSCLSDSDEGRGLEQAVTHLLDSLYGNDLHRSPEVLSGGKRRELTDVLALHEIGACIFEVKALARLQQSTSAKRTISNIYKDISKGFAQLRGAIRSIRSGAVVSDSNGVKLDCCIDAKMLPQAIVLLSDMYPSLDWVRIRDDLLKHAAETGVYFHVFDLHELRVLVGVSPTPKHLLVHLSDRFNKIVEHDHAFVRGRPSKA